MKKRYYMRMCAQGVLLSVIMTVISAFQIPERNEESVEENVQPVKTVTKSNHSNYTDVVDGVVHMIDKEPQRSYVTITIRNQIIGNLSDTVTLVYEEEPRILQNIRQGMLVRFFVEKENAHYMIKAVKAYS